MSLFRLSLKEVVKSAYGWLGILGLLAAVEIVATVVIPLWREYFYGAIEGKDASGFYTGLWLYVGLIVAFVVSQGFKGLVIQKAALLFRDALTYLIAKRAVQRPEGAVEANYDQRIGQDTALATENFIEVGLELLIAVAVIVGILLQMSWDGHQAGLLLAAAIGYSVLSIGVSFLFSRPIIRREKARQVAEAQFRRILIEDGPEMSGYTLRDYYPACRKTWMDWARMMFGFTFFSRLQNSFAVLIPLAVLVPAYFADLISFGQIMGGVGQFDLLVLNFTVIIPLFPRFLQAKASWERLEEYYSQA